MDVGKDDKNNEERWMIGCHLQEKFFIFSTTRLKIVQYRARAPPPPPQLSFLTVTQFAIINIFFKPKQNGTPIEATSCFLGLVFSFINMD